MAETFRMSRAKKCRDQIVAELRVYQTVLDTLQRLDEVDTAELNRVEGLIEGLKKAAKIVTDTFFLD